MSRRDSPPESPDTRWLGFRPCFVGQIVWIARLSPLFGPNLGNGTYLLHRSIREPPFRIQMTEFADAIFTPTLETIVRAIHQADFKPGAGQHNRRATSRQLGDLEVLRGVRSGCDGVAEERGPVALRPRLSPGGQLSRLVATLGWCTRRGAARHGSGQSRTRRLKLCKPSLRAFGLFRFYPPLVSHCGIIRA